MKKRKTQSQTAQLIGRHKSTNSRELARNTGLKVYRPKQACLLAQERFLGLRNAPPITPADWDWAMAECLQDQFNPEQIAYQVSFSHETIYCHVFTDKAVGGKLYRQLHCQKKRKKRYARNPELKDQIAGRKPISGRLAHIEPRAQIAHWEGDTVIGATHQQAIFTSIECNSGYALITKINNKTSDVVSYAIMTKLAPIASPVKNLTFDNRKKFAKYAGIDEVLKSTTYFVDSFAS